MTPCMYQYFGLRHCRCLQDRDTGIHVTYYTITQKTTTTMFIACRSDWSNPISLFDISDTSPTLATIFFEVYYILSIYGSTAPVDLGRFFSFLIYTESVGLLGRGISPSQDRYLHTEHKHRINAHKYPFLEWESNMIPVFERAKTVHALDSAATVIGSIIYCIHNMNEDASWSVIWRRPLHNNYKFTRFHHDYVFGLKKLCIHRKIPSIKKKFILLMAPICRWEIHTYLQMASLP
jgi:hypothetical protein